LQVSVREEWKITDAIADFHAASAQPCMSKPYDSVFKDLLERDPAGWIRLALGSVIGVPTVVDADISTVSGAADKVVVLQAPDPYVVHFEAFASWDSTILARALQYNGIHHRRHALPVDTILVVLRREADHPTLTGVYRVKVPQTHRAHMLEYAVLRVWTLEVDQLLHGSLATLPLVLLADGAEGHLPEVLRRMEERLVEEATPETRKDLWTDAFVLAGLRYRRESVVQFFRGVASMRESDTYQYILEEGIEKGRLQGAVRALWLVAVPRLGEPSASVRERIEAEADLATIEEWLQRVSRSESWAELTR
jgi:predicted transposase YdaD